MNQRVLVVGATGMLGAPVARRLLADGWQVRCLVRDQVAARAKLGAAFEYVVADVTRPETLAPAFADCTCVHLNLRGGMTVESYQRQEVEGAKHCIDAARAHGVRRVSYLSGSGRATPELAYHFPVRVKQAVEAALASSGIPWTVFRATHFMESLPQFVRDGRATVLGNQPQLLHYVAAQDYAAMVSRALELRAAENRPLHIWGPVGMTMYAAVARYVAVRHPGMRVGKLPLPIARLMARFTGNAELAFACQLFSAFAAIGEGGDPGEANRLLGAPSTTLDGWLAEPRP